MLDSLSTPRRPYDFEDYINIVRRNFGWLIAPAFLGLVISTVVAYSTQDIYFSKATIRVTPQQISDQLVQSVTSQDVADRISSMAQTILSRETLSNLVTTYGLYKKELQKMPMQDVVEAMRGAISITPVGGTNAGSKFLPAMQVGFAYSDPHKAQAVCSDLVTRFMNLSTTDVAQSQAEAGDFINTELTQAKQDLEAAEKRLSDFRAQNAGRLPEEMQSNMQEMNMLEGRAEQLTEQANRNTEQRMSYENELNINKSRLAAIQNPSVLQVNPKVQAYDTQIENAENQLAAMREKFTDDYPEVQNMKDTITFLKRQRDAAAKEKVTSVHNPEAEAAAYRERTDLQDN